MRLPISTYGSTSRQLKKAMQCFLATFTTYGTYDVGLIKRKEFSRAYYS
jgi:hypothetical protein